MQASQIPIKFPIPWGADAGSDYIRPIPVASQQGIQAGAASLTDGFPPLTFVPVTAGGAFPFGQDENGILNQITAWSQWQNAGAAVVYDSAFSTAIGGYPNGALLYSAAGGSWWLSTADNNTTDPDTGGANWQQINSGLVYAGNPNGFVAGISPINDFLASSILWDSTNKVLWICTTTGNASGAVWTQLTSSAAYSTFYCGASTGSANAQILTVPTALQTLATGTEIRWKAGYTNTDAMTLAVGSFGTKSMRQDSPTGPIALNGGEIVAGNILTATYDGTYWQLTATCLGTAALANASSNTGTVSAVTGSGSIVPGHISVFVDDEGTIEDGGPLPAFGGEVINSSQSLLPGVYYVDTTGGAITLTLSASVSGAYTFVDEMNYWGVNNLTINGNGNNIGGGPTLALAIADGASTFLANISDAQFYIAAVSASSFWRLV